MTVKTTASPGDPNEEIAALIEVLHTTGQRLEDLTGGEVDSVADQGGRTFLLRRAQDRLRHSEATKQEALLNALPAHIAMIDAQGFIISVNKSWETLAIANVLQGPGYGVGLNYLEICDRGHGENASDARKAAQGIRSVLAGKVKNFSMEYACESPSQQRWFLLNAAPLADDRSNGAVVMHVDVTAEKLARESLRRSEIMKSAILEASLDCVVTIDHKGKIVEFNAAAETTFGWTREDAIGKDMVELIVPPRLRDGHRRGFARYLATGKGSMLGQRSELAAIRADGTEFPIELAITAIATSSTPMFTGFVRDITERKQAAQEMRESERRFSDMLSNVELVSIMIDREARITYCNDYFLRLTGWQREEVLGQSFFELFIPPDLVDELLAVRAALLDNLPEAWHYENEILTRVGERRLIRWNNSVLRSATGDSIGTASIGEDVTESKRAAESLVVERTLLRTLIDAIPNLVFAKDTAGRYTMCNAAELTHLGKGSVGEIIGKSVFDFYPPELAETFHADDLAALSGKPVLDREELGMDAGGVQRWYLTTKGPLHDRAGTIVGMVGSSRDITERKRAEQQLRESEAKYRGLIEQASDGIFITDARGNYQLVNSSALRQLGFTEGEMIGMHGSMTHLEGDRETYASRLQAIAAGKMLRYERMIKRKDGSTFPVEMSANKLGDASVQFMFRDITERKQAEAGLRESEGRFRSFAEQSPDAMLIHQENTIVFVNAAMMRLMRAGDAGALLGKLATSLVKIESAAMAGQRIARLYSGQTVPLSEQVYVRSDGTTVAVEVASSPIVLNGQAAALVTVRDITDRRIQEQKISRLSRIHAVMSGINGAIVRIRDRGELFQEACRIIVEHGHLTLGWIAVLDQATGKLTAVAQAGLPTNAGAGGKLFDGSTALVPGGTAAIALREKRCAVDNAIENAPGAVPEFEADTLKVRRAAIELGAKSVIVLPLVVDRETFGILTLYAPDRNFFDEEEVKLLNELAGNISFSLGFIAKEEKVDYLAYYDALTGLANRTLFLERVAQHMRSAASGGYKLALFLIDLERFKNINDSLGRPAGDELLKQVAEWMTRNAGDANLVARVGADHFAAVLPAVHREGDVARVLERSIATFQEHPFRLNDAVFRVAHKVGITLFPEDGTDADTLFRNAEAALKKAKASGDRYLFYTQAMTETVAGTLTLENQLRQALDKQEFVLHYQPKVNLVNGKLTGAEALIRWNDPRTGLVAPGRFIPILEETGLIYEVGRWALRKALEDYLRWRAAGLPAVRIAVNVSPLQLRNRGFVDEIGQAIGIDPDAAAGLELEITESLVMEDIKHNISSLQAIRLMGVKIAIDDFGTGFSSLSYLSKLPVDTLKIDRSFVLEMTATQEGLALVSTIISLAHSLKLKVVAEGVETEEQSRLLRLLSCDEMQGYLFSRPVPFEVFETKFLALPGALADK